jgi:lipopolysaccharide/colanic/teichoic acid biosynthesis glycosyltransferase
MAKRLFDVGFALIAITVTAPVMLVACLLIWAQDGGWPLYGGHRVGRGGRDFRMLKLRTMVAGGERLGGSSTGSSDPRLTPLGRMLRRFKLDELPQFWNVLVGEMSVVGPRPNFRRGGVERYTAAERELLSVRPGITDVASIVFADEGEILRASPDPDALYDAIIRPWKNRLGLLYVQHRRMSVDLRLIALTIVGLVARRSALRGICAMLDGWGASPQLREICGRSDLLPAGEPPGQMA